MNLKEHLKSKGIEQKLSDLIMLIAELAKPISKELHTRQHYTGTKNVHGDNQVALDVWADELIISKLKDSNLVRTVASEEQEQIIEILKSQGTFGVVMDPLDGSSLIGVNLTVGTIIGIFDEGDVMEPGKNMDAAMYLLYGPLTVLVYAVQGKGVHEFILRPSGEYELQKEDIKVGEKKLYAPGGLRNDYPEKHRLFVEKLEEEGYKLRFSGSCVADVHHIMHKGGIFMYPALKTNPNGKLRLLFEANPLALIIEEAGGACSNSKECIRNIKPDSLSQKTPLYVGSKELIALVEKMFK